MGHPDVRTRQGFSSTALAVILAFVSTSGLAFETGVFQPPSLDGYGYDKKWKTDIDKDNVKETTVVQYKNTAGSKIIELSSENGIVWAWAIRSANYPVDKDDLSKNYTLRDSKCKGFFDEKLSNSEVFEVPSCAK